MSGSRKASIAVSTPASAASSGLGAYVAPLLLTGGLAGLCYFLWKRSQDKIVLADKKDSPLYKLQHPESAASLGAAAPPAAGCWTPPTDAKNLGPGGVFTVTKRNGFLPLVKPLRKLPKEFRELDELMSRLPSYLHDSKGSALADAVASLPCYSIDVTRMTPLEMQCLYRDYAVLVSAYLLEGKTKSGKARDSVPRNVALPFTTLAKHLDQQWIMSYDSYCLSNHYSLIDAPKDSVDPKFAYMNAAAPIGSAHGALCTYTPEEGHWNWDNLRLVRAFDGGAEETTFITIHAEIESHTPKLIQAYDGILTGLRAGSVQTVKTNLYRLRDVINSIVVSQIKMFNASDPRNYERFVRPWIFGWKNSEDHPNGVVFTGVQMEPTKLRGETGAQSTIIPSLDLMLGITHKDDMLRGFLVELEAYRPAAHRAFLRQLRVACWGEDVGPGGAPASATATNDAERAAVAAAPNFGPNPLVSPHKPSTGVKTPHALRDFVRASGDLELVTVFNECIGGVWSFRDVHVTFAFEYIGRYTNRETATGGTPYKAYLRKHRDESITHQLIEFGEECIKKYYQPTREEYEKDINESVGSGVNGIPNHLMIRHRDIIAKHGRGDPSLFRKSFPTGSEFVQHAPGPVSGGF